MSVEARAGVRGSVIGNATASSPLVAEIEDVRRRQKLFEVLEARFDQIAERCFDEAAGGKAPQIVAVASALKGEGATTIATGLAAAAARNMGRDVLLVETSLTKPVLARDFNVDPAPGLAQYLDGTADIEQIIRRTRGAWLLPGGTYETNPGPLFHSERMRQLVDSLRGLFGAVVMDVPPMLSSAHAPALVRRADALVLTCRAGRTHVEDVRRAIELAGDIELRGLILNRTRKWVPDWIARFAGISASGIE